MAYIAPAGTHFQVNNGGGRRVPYVRTTGYFPMTGNPHQPMATWAVRTEAAPQIAGRPNRLGESMFGLPQGPKAYQGAGSPIPDASTQGYGTTPARPGVPAVSSGCILFGDPQHWMSSCPLILEEFRRAAAQPKASTGGWPTRARGPTPVRQQIQGGVLAVEEAPAHRDTPEDATKPSSGNE